MDYWGSVDYRGGVYYRGSSILNIVDNRGSHMFYRGGVYKGSSSICSGSIGSGSISCRSGKITVIVVDIGVLRPVSVVVGVSKGRVVVSIGISIQVVECISISFSIRSGISYSLGISLSFTLLTAVDSGCTNSGGRETSGKGSLKGTSSLGHTVMRGKFNNSRVDGGGMNNRGGMDKRGCMDNRGSSIVEGSGVSNRGSMNGVRNNSGSFYDRFNDGCIEDSSNRGICRSRKSIGVRVEKELRIGFTLVQPAHSLVTVSGKGTSIAGRIVRTVESRGIRGIQGICRISFSISFTLVQSAHSLVTVSRKGTSIAGCKVRAVVSRGIRSIQGVRWIGFRLCHTEGSKGENSGLKKLKMVKILNQ